MVEKRPPPAAEIEYKIMTFAMPGAQKKSEIQWEEHETLSDMSAAMQKAQALIDGGKYHKVEVKKKFFDQKKNRSIDMSLQVLEAKIKKDFTIPLFLFLAIAAGAIAFVASFFLTK